MGDTTNLLVGYGSSDDAAVYKIDEKKVLVQSVDLFPPMVDDPYLFGQIAASNSLSDIYAMGASPNLCMNILAFPSDMNLEYVRSILEGGYEKVIEAGAVIAGGHTLNDNEPKYGLSVTGITEIDKVLRNDNAKEGDLLILTKPIGNGIINNAFKGGHIPKEATDKAIEYMAMLNKSAFEIMSKYKVNSCTDITGFGLLGHLYEMAVGSGKTLEIFKSKVPILGGAVELAMPDIIPGGTLRNKSYVGADISLDTKISENLLNVYFNPETSGGLLISLPEKQALKLISDLKQSLECAEIIGQVKKRDVTSIQIKD
jgi:selenide,water dikinase